MRVQDSWKFQWTQHQIWWQMWLPLVWLPSWLPTLCLLPLCCWLSVSFLCSISCAGAFSHLAMPLISTSGNIQHFINCRFWLVEPEILAVRYPGFGWSKLTSHIFHTHPTLTFPRSMWHRLKSWSWQAWSQDLQNGWTQINKWLFQRKGSIN